MKTILKVLMALMLSIFAVGCFASNTDIRPQKVYAREFKGLRVEIARSDLSGVFVDFENRAEQPVSIVWEKSTLGGSEIVRHDGIVNTSLNHEETTFTPLERKSFVIHRKVDFYYLDPTLYSNGGLRIKPLKYPVELRLVVKMLGKEEVISLFIDNNYVSMEDAKSERYQKDAYAIEAEKNANAKDKDYVETELRQYENENRRTKANAIPKTVGPFNDNAPVEDTLIIDHRK